MIIFHEGLPRSGKSYEACVKQIIPALLKGRQVFAYVEGIDHQKFADVTGISLEHMRGKTELKKVDASEYSNLSAEEKTKVIKGADGWYLSKFTGLLHQIELEQVKTISKHVANDSLVVIDEVQDHWPAAQKSLDPDITKFVTQHGHRGIDIIVMGQDHRDCHALWKRRIDQMFVFVKQDVIGRPTKYTWSSYKQNKGKFIKITSGTGEYDQQYFGLYKSHTDGTSNTATHADDRANVLKTPLFKYGMPAVLAIGLFSAVYTYKIFTGDVSLVNVPEKPKAEPPKVVHQPVKPPEPVKREESKKAVLTYSHGSYIEEVITESKPRLGAIIEGTDINGGRVITAFIQFMDKSHHVVEQFTLDQLAAFGWGFQRMPYGIKLVKGDKNIAVTSWPLENYGKPPSALRSVTDPN